MWVLFCFVLFCFVLFCFCFCLFFLYSSIFFYRFFFNCLCIMIVYILGAPFNNGGYLVHFWNQVWDGCGLCFEGYIYP